LPNAVKDQRRWWRALLQGRDDWGGWMIVG
jgi:hypothetical protein